jgi:hypothetical protein
MGMIVSKRVEISTVGAREYRLEVRSYYDQKLRQHFALMPPGDDTLSRIAIPCSVCDLNEKQFGALLSIGSAVWMGLFVGLNRDGTVHDWKELTKRCG